MPGRDMEPVVVDDTRGMAPPANPLVPHTKLAERAEETDSTAINSPGL